MSNSIKKHRDGHIHSNRTVEEKPRKSRRKTTVDPRLITTNDIWESGRVKRPDQMVGSVGFHRRSQRQRKKDPSRSKGARVVAPTKDNCFSCSTVKVRDRSRSQLGRFKGPSTPLYKDSSSNEKISVNSMSNDASQLLSPSSLLISDHQNTDVQSSLKRNSIERKETSAINIDDISLINTFAGVQTRVPLLRSNDDETVLRIASEMAAPGPSSSPVQSSVVPLSIPDVVRSGISDSHPTRDGLPSEAVIGVAVGSVIAFWILIAPIIRLLLRKSFQSQTKLFQRRVDADEACAFNAKGSILMEEVETLTTEKARLYRPESSPHPARFPGVYAPLPQVPLSPASHHQRDGVQVLAIPCDYNGHPDTLWTACLNDRLRESTYNETVLSGCGDSMANVISGDGYCVCHRERFSSVPHHVETSPTDPFVFPWRPKRVVSEVHFPSDHRPRQVSFQPSRTDSRRSLSAFGGAAAPTRKFPKMGQTCLRNSYNARSRGRRRAEDWSSADTVGGGGGRPRPEGRARSEDRTEEEVLINRCVRNPVGYRRLPRTGSVSPRCRSKKEYADPT